MREPDRLKYFQKKVKRAQIYREQRNVERNCKWIKLGFHKPEETNYITTRQNNSVVSYLEVAEL